MTLLFTEKKVNLKNDIYSYFRLRIINYFLIKFTHLWQVIPLFVDVWPHIWQVINLANPNINLFFLRYFTWSLIKVTTFMNIYHLHIWQFLYKPSTSYLHGIFGFKAITSVFGIFSHRPIALPSLSIAFKAFCNFSSEEEMKVISSAKINSKTYAKPAIRVFDWSQYSLEIIEKKSAGISSLSFLIIISR